jgi:ElaB/YqjD/DUF883 family membrane-anchored ribosome-binding protein
MSDELSIDQAVATMAPEQERKEPAAAQAAETAAAEPTQTEPAEQIQAATTAEDGSEAAQPGDAETAETEDEPEGLKLEPPRWWSKDKKDRFKELPPELQAVVFEQEETRERVTAKAKQEAADARKAADAEIGRARAKVATLDTLVPRAEQMFQNRWANVDWATLATQVEPGEYNRLRVQYEQEAVTVQALAGQQRQAAAERFTQFVQAEAEKLKTVVPDLVDEKLGLERKANLGKFLMSVGFPADRIAAMSAEEAGLAYDAMRWRDAQSKAATLARQPKQPVPQRPAVKPSSTGARSPQSGRLATLSQKRSLSTDEAVELLNAR